MEQKGQNGQEQILVGIDVGSTTTKVAVMEVATGKVLFSDYTRHHSDQLQSVSRAVKLVKETLAGRSFLTAMTGSGAKHLSEELRIPYVQEVVANSIALKAMYGEIGTAIELGGQDAKIIFFQRDKRTGELQVADMRMNGSCAGGTGAFVDEIASLLKTPVEEFDALAAQGTTVYDISGRCGVYAKTDIQPLLNQGVKKSDLALSSFHAIAKQTIGGLAQGLSIEKPVVFEGGPLTFNRTLVRVFAERLDLRPEEILSPDRPELLIACGAARAAVKLFSKEEALATADGLLDRIEKVRAAREEAKKQSEAGNGDEMAEGTFRSRPFFADQAAQTEFQERHRRPERKTVYPRSGSTLRAYLGIDSGSTTTKFVLLDENEELLDSFYAPNQGDPLTVAKKALIAMREKYASHGVRLEILAAGTTGYGEMLFSRAFSTETHAVETVAHARAAAKYTPDATFLLDIGGQDMKAIWLDNGVITNIVVNEACSSGCGSFLENFASSLHIPAREIAEKAFSSQHPAALGSRCTVFMTSSIVTEQRNGKLPEDIMAGLCRSIIENVFTKVIRVSNLDSLGKRIVVQGGTFENDAVLCALEQYVGRPVIRAPYPGIMGAIGAALLAKEETKSQKQPHFIGLDQMESLTWQQEANVPCPFCMNHCQRAVVRFSNGTSWITNNRCERGEILGDPKDVKVRERLKIASENRNKVPNLYKLREELLFADYLDQAGEGDASSAKSHSERAAAKTGLVPKAVSDTVRRNITIGLPRVLAFWDTMPFWTTFWRSLGFEIQISSPSTHKMFEEGLSAVTSDTVCFPAKLVHGHIRDLVKKKVDRIFMPSIAAIGSENTESTSESMCAVVKGYPLVIRNSDSPEKQWGIPFDAPLFYWYREEDKERQLITYMEQTFSIQPSETKKAVLAGNDAMRQFRSRLKEAGAKVLEEVEKEGRYAVVLASRPYQNDALVNHSLPELLTEFGVPVLTADSVPGIENVDLSHSRLDVVNNYHARMLASAVLAAQSQNLEYVQFVSFGCGHDAYLSDEIQRMMREISGKSPLILKLDESEVQGPLRIRVRSFLETINMRRKKREMAERLQNQPGTSRQENAGGGNECGTAALGPDIQKSWQVHELSDPYPVKFEVDDRKKRTVLVPNTSHAFCRIMSAALKTQGIRAVPLAVGREEAIRLGKQYVHNDICFPAQIVIGEALAALRSGQYVPSETAIGMGKYIGDCRLTHYSALLRKALDDAGYPEVAILTNDDVDYHDLHPGFRMNLMSAIRLAGSLPMIDILEELLRKIRPYEKVSGSSDQAFDEAMDFVVDGLEQHGLSGALRGFKKAIQRMNAIEYDRSQPRPRVLIVGEYLLNFHPGANHEIERYLEKNGFEIIEARMTDVIRKTYFCQDEQIRTYHLKKPFVKKNWYHVANRVFDVAHAAADRIAKQHPLYTPVCRLPELVKESDPIIPHTFDAGEGVLIPGEILHHAEHGCRAFVILQPFGCLPNHVVGRGIVKKMREMYPDAQILPLDYDPDVSFANLENRLQMLIMNVKERSVDSVALPDAGQRNPVETMNRKQKNADNKKQKVS